MENIARLHPQALVAMSLFIWSSVCDVGYNGRGISVIHSWVTLSLFKAVVYIRVKDKLV